MKLFDVDWANVLAQIPRWTALPHPARRVILDELKTHGYVQGYRFGEHLDDVIASGIPEFDPIRNRTWVGEEQRELVKVLRAMRRHQVFESPSHGALIKYLEEHFTNQEIGNLGASVDGAYYGYVTRQMLASRIAFAGWVSDLLDAHDDQALAVWGESRGLRASPSADNPITVLRNLRQLAKRVATSHEGVPLPELLAQLRKTDIVSFAEALHVGLATGVIFAGMRSDDLEPMVGLWPDVVRELTRPPATPPSATVPVEQFALAVVMEDMTTLLATIVASPVRVRANDGAVFASARREIEMRLVHLPPWAAHLFVNDRSTRVDVAASELDARGYIEMQSQGGNPHLHATAEAGRWLSLTPRERLASLIDPVRQSKDINPSGAWDYSRAEGFFPFFLPYSKAPKGLSLRDDLTKMFLGLSGGFVPLEGFLDYAEREANPFFALPQSVAREFRSWLYGGHSADLRENFRKLWRDMLKQFLVMRLIGFGGASIGRLENDSLSFALTDAGRYLLGATEDFEYGSTDVGDVVVQPNFDIVFLGAAPGKEATLGRFAQRVGAAPGLVFRITRASVLGAAEAGASADDIIGALRQASSKSLPKNVEREIIGWVSAVRRGRLRVMEVIECADEETADRVIALLGAKAQRITSMIIEVSAASSSARLAMIRKLRAGGVFLESTIRDAAPRSTRRRRRKEDWEDEEL